jgi:hypothetical protein
MNKEFIYNPELIIPILEFCPHTYDTILGENKTPTTNTVLRRKIGKLCKYEQLCKTKIPGTRCGQVIFYTLNKKYKILVKNERMGISVFYFSKFKRLNNFYLRVEEYNILKGNEWKEVKAPKIFFANDVLKLI